MATTVFLVAGCAAETVLQPTPGGFQFQGFANNLMPIDTAEGEATRIRFLEERLEQNGLCPAGYEIVDRQAEFVGGASWRVYYSGQCL
ncbi:MAG: hypothetical protein AAGJ74_13485 [Pseudomonadota bacterium]